MLCPVNFRIIPPSHSLHWLVLLILELCVSIIADTATGTQCYRCNNIKDHSLYHQNCLMDPSRLGGTNSTAGLVLCDSSCITVIYTGDYVWRGCSVDLYVIDGCDYYWEEGNDIKLQPISACTCSTDFCNAGKNQVRSRSSPLLARSTTKIKTSRATELPTVGQMQIHEAPSNSILGRVIGSIFGSIGFLSISLGLCLYVRRRRRVSMASVFALSERWTTPYLRSDPDISMEIAREKVLYGKTVIGSGEFGIVYKGSMFEADESSHNLNLVAVKDVYCGNLQAFQQFVKEVEVMAKLEQHTNVVALLGVVSKGKQLIVMEYCALGSIGAYLLGLKQKQNFRCCVHKSGDLEGTWIANQHEWKQSTMYLTEDVMLYPRDCGLDGDILSTYDLVNFSYQIARGMEFLAAYHIIHRDLAARNVLMCENRVVKIGDFGLARREQFNYIMLDNQVDNTKLPAKWMPPEALKELLFNEKTDVWSFGVVLWEMFSLGEIPFSDPGQCTIESDTVAWWIQMLEGGHRLNKPSGTPLEMYAIMQSCWSLNPAERLGFRDLRSTLQQFFSVSAYLKLDNSQSKQVRDGIG